MLKDIGKAVQQGRYTAAAHTCKDFIIMSSHLERRTDLFLGEVLESVCLQNMHELVAHDIPPDVGKELNENMAKQIDRLIAAYGAQDSVSDILVDIWYDATIFQFKTSRQYAVRRSPLNRPVM